MRERTYLSQYQYGVCLEAATGPREILPESLWTGITRQGLGVTGWHASLERAEGNFTITDGGVWLPNANDSENDLSLALAESRKTAADLMVEDADLDMMRSYLGSVSLGVNGCWQADNADGLGYLVKLDTKSNLLERPEDIGGLRRCSSESCVYHRHYDITLGVPSNRRELLYPNMEHFMDIEAGILTSWGDILPPVSESREELRDFQKQSIPFRSRESSLLSASGVASISLLPTTGCWFSNNYYMTPLGVSGYESWQYDGYSRLRIPSPIAEEYGYASYAVLGHRVVWLLSGGELPDPKDGLLNHRCGFRPCVNPGHTEIVTPSQNMQHSQLMQIASAMMAEKLTITEGIPRLESWCRSLGMDPGNVRPFWNKE